MSAIVKYLLGPGWPWADSCSTSSASAHLSGPNAAYLVLAERKGAGRIQRRPGPNEAGYAGWLQPVADGIKLLSKQVMIPRARTACSSASPL